MNRENKKCKDLVHEKFEKTMKYLKELLEAENNETEDLGSLQDYGLDISLIEAGTFEGQRADYICYQLSWGGPSDEFRIFKNGDIEYWYMDWFDGAKIDVVDEKEADIIKEIVLPFFDDFLV